MSQIAEKGHRNANGVEIVSIAIGIEDNSFYDQHVMRDPARWGFDLTGIDCVLDGDTRTQIREGIAYYSGYSANVVIDKNRRNIVILNGVADSPNHKAWEVLHTSPYYISQQRDRILAAIDSVMPGERSGASEEESFASWMVAAGLPGEDPFEDSDGDGLSNALEYYFDTSPTIAGASPLRYVHRHGARWMAFPARKIRSQVSVEIEASHSLTDWHILEIPENDFRIATEGSMDQAEVKLPSESAPFARLRVTLSE